ncbi:hypothetical protein GQ55_6G026100 [Panicum hallii var. hallii]|uniref:MADS-box domain-containing protein n=1 Tax=Panicum hallii var. hallii TaxID=1504633 RepID=A0A2T7D355_9POAL|nr:hypothetical protein GQ55_6G026100 [Panicum hallii var. hallii]
MATGAAAAANASQQQRQARFEAKHAELLSEARGVAREFGVDVCAVAFRPDGTAARHEFLGVAREARAVGRIRRAVARDVSAMGLREVAEHERQLRALRAVVERELQAKAAARDKATKAAGAAAGDKRAPEQQQQQAGGAGDSKIRRIIIG